MQQEVANLQQDVKRLSKLDKSAKRHGAMNEELKKMEAETGISVSAHRQLHGQSVCNVSSAPRLQADRSRVISSLNESHPSYSRRTTMDLRITYLQQSPYQSLYYT